MSFTFDDIQRIAAELGFRADTLEKVYRLLSLLDALRSHPFLRHRIALKGGTALNLFVFDVPRLSVDLDFNYVGAIDRDDMLEERPLLERAVQAVAERENLTVKRVPGEHAGGKWRLSYTTSQGSSDKLEVDLNYLLRVPLWPVQRRSSNPVGPLLAEDIPILDLHELAAGKLVALCARRASRDLFDSRELLRRTDLTREKLRLGFVVLGGINRRDWREVSLDDVDVSTNEVERALLPMLRDPERPTKAELDDWTRKLVTETRDLMGSVLPLTDNETAFIERLNTCGDIFPDLLTEDPQLRETIRRQPGLQWKALHVRRHAGGRRADGPDPTAR